MTTERKDDDARLAVFEPPSIPPPPGPGHIKLYRYKREYDTEGRSYRPWQYGDAWNLSLEEAQRIYDDLGAALASVPRFQEPPKDE